MIAELTRDQRALLGLRGPISYSQIVRASLKLERGGGTAPQSTTRTTRGTAGHSAPRRHHVAHRLRGHPARAHQDHHRRCGRNRLRVTCPPRREGQQGDRRGPPVRRPDAILGTEPRPRRTPTPGTSGRKSPWSRTRPTGRRARDQAHQRPPSSWLQASAPPARDRGGVTAGLVLWCHKRQPIRECLVDRGISQSADENFCGKPMREAGIGIVVDPFRTTEPTPRISDDRVMMINGGVSHRRHSRSPLQEPAGAQAPGHRG